MEAEVVKLFNTELVSLYELRPPISKKKIVDITKAALKAIKYYKHVVFNVERFLMKCKPEYKIPGLYCIDSIIRQSRHQFKEKDVFAPRFALNMPATLANLLNCKQEDKLKVVRVLNLWKSHEIYDSVKVRPWLEYCRDSHGLEIDFVQVERIVKGDQADFSIYSRVPGRPEKRKVEMRSPPPRSPRAPIRESRARTPPPKEPEPSDEAMEGGVSERETLNMLKTMGLDLGGMFSSDHSLLQQISKMVNDKLVERREMDSKRQGNIKNLLSREFDYSDEEDSGDEELNRRLQIETKPAELTKQQIMGMAEAVLRDPDTKEEIQRMHTERISALSQAAAARVQAIKAQSTAPVMPPMPAPIPIPLNPVNDSSTPVHSVVASQSTTVQPPAPMPSSVPPVSTTTPQPTAQNLLAARTAQQILLNAQGGVPPFSPNMPPPNFLAMLQQPQLPPSLPPGAPPTMQAPSRSLPQQQQQMNRRNEYDQDDRLDRMNDDRDKDDRERRDKGDRDRRHDRSSRDRERERNRERERDRGDSRNFGDAKRPRQSRSRGGGDRDFDDMRNDHHRSGSHGRRGSSKSHMENDRNDRDRDNMQYRDIERQRRKMGLPWPPKEGHVLIASCTLWLGRIPGVCTENDIRAAVSEGGEPARITIIHSRACAYVTMKDRKSAFKVIDRLQRNFEVAKKSVKLSWGIGQGLKGDKYADYWDANRGITLIPYDKLPEDLDPLVDGGHLDVESLPPHLANLYDERGRKGKLRMDAMMGQSLDPSQIPQLPLPPFPFPIGQPPRLPGAPPFLPPGMVPVPGMFPPGMPPPINALPPTSAAGRSSKNGNADNDPNASTLMPPTVPQLPNVGNGERMPMPGVNPYMPPNFVMPPPRFSSNNRGAYDASSHGGRGGRPPLLPAGLPPDHSYRGRPPYGGPHSNYSMMPPVRPPRMTLSAVPPGMPAHPPPEMSQDRNEFGMKTEKHDEREGRESDLGLPTSSHEEPDQSVSSQSEGKEVIRAIDEPCGEPVTSTTLDDESSVEPSAVVEVNGADCASDDLKAVTQNEDRLLAHAIVYGNGDDSDDE